MQGWRVRGLRGATTVPDNTAEAIVEATKELLQALQEANGFGPDDVVSALFTATPDLNAAFPASAARELGWVNVPLLDASHMAVAGDIPRCVRVLLQVYTDREGRSLQHVYLRGARELRPDLR
jgi:chorismate mutase